MLRPGRPLPARELQRLGGEFDTAVQQHGIFWAPGRQVAVACSLQSHARARPQAVRERQLLCAAHSRRQRVSSSFSNLLGPRLIMSDLAVFKSIAFTERKRLEFRASAYLTLRFNAARPDAQP